MTQTQKPKTDKARLATTTTELRRANRRIDKLERELGEARDLLTLSLKVFQKALKMVVDDSG
jgi:hypothetical protein